MSGATAVDRQQRQKELGAFYTPSEMAVVLTDWAVRDPGDRVLDPSFGGLAFLGAARARLRELGAPDREIARQLYGVDLDEDAHAAARAQAELGVRADHLLDRDFFELDSGELPSFEAVVGNPPYIRYQGFNGRGARARELAADAGVKMTRLASSWAPFVVHAASFVAPGGRLAQVLPAELLHAQYATEVLEFLRRSFASLAVATFEERVFPGAMEDVVLLFADGHGEGSCGEVSLVSCRTLAEVRARVEAAPATGDGTAEGEPVDAPGRGKLLAQLLPREVRALYRRLASEGTMRRLGEVASVDIGLVTGANDFFVLAEDDAEDLHPDLLAPAVCRATQVAGARLATAEHRRMLESGGRGLMLVADPGMSGRVLRTARRYLERGEEAGIHERYKCRIRDPWWALPVPREGPPELLLTYCSNEHPRLAVNEAGTLNTNTLHGVRPAAGEDGRALAAGFYNSLTQLSAELVGRSYGGGVLKLEPTEAEAVLIPRIPAELGELLPRVDEAIRGRDLEAATDLVDPVVLGPLGLSERQVKLLRSARRKLQERRRRRGRPAR